MTTADPVADKSTFLCMYMSNHPDTLVAYVRHWGKVKAAVSSAKMTSIDTKGMNLAYTVKGTDAKNSVRVAFDPPLSGYEEVKPRLLGMTADAQEALGMTKAPQVTTFIAPPAMFITLIPLGLQTYVTLAALYPATDARFAAGRFVSSYIGGLSTLKGLWTFVAVIHTLEALYTLSLCRRHRMPLFVAIQFVLSVLVCGFPVITDLRRRIQTARIDSIMKGN